MLMFLIVGPIALHNICGKKLVMLVPWLVTSAVLFFVLPTPKGEHLSEADVIVSGINFLAGAVTLLSLWCLTLICPLEKNLADFPWCSTYASVKDVGHLVRQGRAKCPFTNDEGVIQCTSCKCVVSARAYHTGSASTLLGTFIINPPDATEALDSDDAFQGRLKLDEALDLRADLISGGVTACCIGCKAYYRCWKSLARSSLLCACMGALIATAPFAFNVGAVWDDSSIPRMILSMFSGFFCFGSILLLFKLIAESFEFFVQFERFDYPYPNIVKIAKKVESSKLGALLMTKVFGQGVSLLAHDNLDD